MADFSTHIRRGQPIVMGLLCFFAFVEACITSYTVSKFNGGNDYPNTSFRDRLRFLCFAAWWTFFFTLAYIAIHFTAATSWAASILSHTVWVFLTWLFWMAGTAALTDTIGGHTCSNAVFRMCNHIMAAEAFGWIIFVLMTFALIVCLLIGGSAFRRGDSIHQGIAV